MAALSEVDAVALPRIHFRHEMATSRYEGASDMRERLFLCRL